MNQDHANTGYVVAAQVVVDYFCSKQSRINGHAYDSAYPTSQDRGWENHLKMLLVEAVTNEEQAEKLLEALQSAMRRAGLPKPDDCFVMNDEDTSDELQRGHVYLVFDGDALFVRTPTESMARMICIERGQLTEIGQTLVPRPAQWCKFG